MRTNARANGLPFARTKMGTVCAGIAALTALTVVLPLAGCGSGKGTIGKGVGSSVTRKKGSVSLTIVWPERTRLIPDAANSIVVTLTRNADADFPTPIVKTSPVIRRPATGTTTVTTTFDNLEIGTYAINATAYPSTDGPAAPPNPGTGTYVPVATKTVGNIQVGETPTTARVTMESTIAQLVPNLDATFPHAADGNLILLPGQQIQFDIIALDATPATATPPGPYRVLFSKSKLVYEVTNTTGLKSGTTSVTVDGLVTVGTLSSASVPGKATIKVTDTESGKSSSVVLNVNPSGVSTVAQWARFRGDSQNTGRVAITNILQNNQQTNGWPYFTGSQIIFSSPVIAQDGTIYIGTVTKDIGSSAGDRKFYAINPDGSIKWTFDDGGNMGNIQATATIAQDGTIFIGSISQDGTTGNLYALKDNGAAKGASIVWKKSLPGPIYASVALGQDNTVYVATDAPDSKVYAFNGFTGTAQQVKQLDGTFTDWVFTGATGGVEGAPALSHDGYTLYVTTLDGGLYGIRTGKNPIEIGATQKFPRIATDSSGIIASPVVTCIQGREAVLVATIGGKLFAFNADNGGPLQFWPQPTTGQAYYDALAPLYSSPAVAEDLTQTVAGVPGGHPAKFIYIATLDNTSGLNDHKVVALNAADATESWRTPEQDSSGNSFFSDGFTSSPALSKDGKVLFLGSFNGNVYGIDADPKNTSDRHGLIQVGGVDWVYTTPGTGDPTQPTNNLESSPALDKLGHVYIGGYNGAVYSIGTN